VTSRLPPKCIIFLVPLWTHLALSSFVFNPLISPSNLSILGFQRIEWESSMTSLKTRTPFLSFLLVTSPPFTLIGALKRLGDSNQSWIIESKICGHTPIILYYNKCNVLKASPPPHLQTWLFIKSCNIIALLMLRFYILCQFCSGHFKPIKSFFLLWIWTVTNIRLDVKTSMVFECMKGLLWRLQVGTMIIKQYCIFT